MKTTFQVWDLNHDRLECFKKYRNKHLIAADFSSVPKDGKYHHMLINKDGIKEEVYLDGKKVPFALLP